MVVAALTGSRLRLSTRNVASVRVWTLDEATAALPQVREIVERLRAAANAPAEHSNVSGNGHGPSTPSHELQAALRELDDLGIIVRDPQRGLIDFPAQTGDGRTYLLCWLDGEDAIDWWHWPDEGFAGRTPITQPPE
jgi:hypothetical protein